MYKMFRFILKVFYIGSLFLSSLASTAPLSCISMNNQACKIRPEIINVNSNEPILYPFSIKTSNVVIVAIMLMVHMQKYVFLML